MSHEKLLKWLMKIGTGWLGWSPAEVRGAHIQEILIAHEGKIEMLKACFGSSEKEKKITPANTAAQFDQMFGVR